MNTDTHETTKSAVAEQLEACLRELDHGSRWATNTSDLLMFLVSCQRPLVDLTTSPAASSIISDVHAAAWVGSLSIDRRRALLAELRTLSGVALASMFDPYDEQPEVSVVAHLPEVCGLLDHWHGEEAFFTDAI